MKRYLSLFLILLLLFTSCADAVITTVSDSLPTDSTGVPDTTPLTGDAESVTQAKDSSTKEPLGTTAPVTTVIPPEPIDPDCHKDDNNDGTCDICQVTVVVVIDFYAINDIHGKFKDSSTQVGVDELTTYLKNCRETDDHTVFLSSGDTWQGSSESNLTEGLIFTEWMNALGFVSMTLGNHEYDWGSDSIRKNAAIANFPMLAINIYDRSNSQRVDYVSSSVMIERGGAKVGIIGAIGDCYSSIAADKSEDVYFKTGNELTALVKAESEKLRAWGADFIVYSIHDGYGSSKSFVNTMSDSAFSSYYDTVLSDGYVDLVFEAHTHQNYVLRDSYGVYHLQGGGDNKGITHAEVGINIANGKTDVRLGEYLPTSRYEALEGDGLVDELLEKYRDEISRGDEVVGKNGSYKNSKVLCQTVADLYYQVGVDTWGRDYPIALAGAFIQARSPYNLAAGDVTYSQLQMIFPFDNQIVLCSILGKDLRRVFYESPHSSYYMHYSEYGETLWSNINDYATYYVITDTYSSTYRYNNMTEVARYAPDVFARDLLADYIARGLMK